MDQQVSASKLQLLCKIETIVSPSGLVKVNTYEQVFMEGPNACVVCAVCYKGQT